MRYLITTVFSFFLLLTGPVYAGSGHDHGHSHAPVTKAEAEKTAMGSVAALADKNKIDSSWQGVPVYKSEKKEFSGQMEWVVMFQNKAVSDPEKQILYIFLTLDGQYIAANFTGN